MAQELKGKGTCTLGERIVPAQCQLQKGVCIVRLELGNGWVLKLIVSLGEKNLVRVRSSQYAHCWSKSHGGCEGG